MKFFRLLFIFFVAVFSLQSCKKEYSELWKEEVKTTESVKITDISGDYFNSAISLQEFKVKYPWFQGTVPDEDYSQRRKDTAERRIYKEAVQKIDKAKLQQDLSVLFSRVRHYFPKFKTPQVYLYSSSLQSVLDPVFFRPEERMLFVDMSAFMGEKNRNYTGMEEYFKKSMNPENMLPKISEMVAETLVHHTPNQNKFIDKMISQGKIMTLQDVFLPNTPDELKIGYTKQQQEWAAANEGNIWNYFIENNLVFSDDAKLSERFLAPGPFSKFYTEVDIKSSPRVGVFTGWQICRAFFVQNPKASLQDFLKMNATDIFNQSKYKPLN